MQDHKYQEEGPVLRELFPRKRFFILLIVVVVLVVVLGTFLECHVLGALVYNMHSS